MPAGQGQSPDDGAGRGMLDGEPHDQAVAEQGDQAVDEEPGGERVPHGDRRRPAALLEAVRGAGEAACLHLGEDGTDVVLGQRGALVQPLHEGVEKDCRGLYRAVASLGGVGVDLVRNVVFSTMSRGWCLEGVVEIPCAPHLRCISFSGNAIAGRHAPREGRVQSADGSCRRLQMLWTR